MFLSQTVPEGVVVDQQELEKTKWELDKHIPLSLIIAMAIQTVTFAWWLSSNMTEIRGELRTASLRIEEIWRDRYTKEDARRDSELGKLRDEDHIRRIDDLDRRIRQLEGGRMR